MKHTRAHIAVVCTVLIPLLFAGDLPCEMRTGPRRPAAEKTLTRRYDPIVVTGDLLPGFHGLEIGQMRLLAWHNDRLQVVPFQIDERDPDGEYVFTGGDAAGTDVDQGRFDYNDELVFMAGDTGAQVLPPQCAGAGDIVSEIRIQDPKNPAQAAWVYLAYYAAAPPPLSAQDYVTYIPGEEKVFSRFYQMKYRKGSPFYMDLSYPIEAGGSGKDFFDRIKVRLSVTAFFNLIHIEKNEDDFRSVVVGWKDGPVRAMRKVENYFRILFNLSSPSIFSVNEYYARLTYTPVQLTIPFRLKWVFNAFAVNDWTWTIYGDFPGLKGGAAYTDRNTEGFRFTGNHTEEYLNRHIDMSRFSWGYNTKPGVGTWFPNLLLPEMLYGIVTLHIVDDENRPDPPEDVPGLIGAGMKGRWRFFHRDLVDLLEPGTYELSMDTYFPHPSIQIDEVEEWLQIRQFPLWVEVTDRAAKTSPIPQDTGPMKTAEFGPPDDSGDFRGRIVDTRGRSFSLRRLYFYTGSYRVTPRTRILSRHFNRNEYSLVDFQHIRQIHHRYEAVDPISKMANPMVQEIRLHDGRTLTMLGCKPCGFSGIQTDGKKRFFWATQIRSISFPDPSAAAAPPPGETAHSAPGRH